MATAYIVQHFGYSQTWKDGAEFEAAPDAIEHARVLRATLGESFGPLRVIRRSDEVIES